MSAERPFKIAVPDEDIVLLKKKLELTRFPDELEMLGNEYDWRKHEAQLNKELPQFTCDTEVEGFGPLNVHYVHRLSSVSSAIPLLSFMDVGKGPGSFLEVRKILPLLVEDSPEHPSFHVEAIGLPAFRFSEAPKKKGLGIAQHAEVSHKLMLALGYNEYVTQGGDAGAVITRRIAVDYGKKHNKAWHTNMPFKPGKTGPPQAWNSPMSYLRYLITQYTPAEKAGLERRRWFQKDGIGYHMEQSTQPQTLGYGLADSPAGLLGWIFEKLVNWADDYPWADDEGLLPERHHFLKPSAASVRIYYEYVKHGIPDPQTTAPVHVPTGHSYFPKELEVLPRLWLKAPNLVFEYQHESGGHFAAHERPEVLVSDLRKMFGREGPAFGVVGSHNGFKP